MRMARFIRCLVQLTTLKDDPKVGTSSERSGVAGVVSWTRRASFLAHRALQTLGLVRTSLLAGQRTTRTDLDDRVLGDLAHARRRDMNDVGTRADVLQILAHVLGVGRHRALEQADGQPDGLADRCRIFELDDVLAEVLLPEVVEHRISEMTRALRDDEEDVPLLLDRCDDLFERGVVLRTVADQSFELCLRRAAVRHLVADEEEVAFLAALLERVALRAVR